MASSTIAEAIPHYFDREFFLHVLEQGLRKTGLRILNVRTERLSLGGENYCSNIYRVAVEYACDEGETDAISLIVKNMPAHKQSVLSQLKIYAKEILFYMDIKPDMEALMWHAEGHWNLGAKLFHSSTKPEQNIVFEDLDAQGFKQQRRQLGLDLAHATLTLKKLGQFHAATMVIAAKKPEVIVDRYPFGLLNADSIRAAPFQALFGAQLLKLASLVNESPEFESISKKLLNYYENFTERVLQAVYPLQSNLNVLNHGDLWVNNLFFKYDVDAYPTEIRFIDFQLCYYGSPGFDINYFLNTSVQLDVLREQRLPLIRCYFEALTETLERLPYNKPLPTFEAILNEVHQHEAYGFFVAFGFFPLMSMDSADSQDNSLERLHDREFARRKVELMFTSNARTMATLKYALRRLDDLHLLD